jgi:two-component system nitrate/nitrite response regulator NarP
MEKRTIDVAIASPFDLWCMGMEKLIADIGWKTSRRCSNAEQLLNLARTTQFDFLIVAKSVLDYVDIEEYLDQFREYSYAKILLILEPFDTLSSLNVSKMSIDGLILSTANRNKFDECLCSVCDGTRWIDEQVSAIVDLAKSGLHRIGDLSRREFEVARLAASGLSNKQIGRILEVSDGTIKVHMHHILSKLNLGSRIDLSWSASELFAEPDEKSGKQPFYRPLTRH